jgi:sugar lactone lactonase YvrE
VGDSILKVVITLAAVIIASLLLTCTAAASFWADEMMESLLSRGIIDALPDNPNEKITREDFAVMLAKAMRGYNQNRSPGLSFGIDEMTASAAFGDWAEIKSENLPYILYLYEEGILRGTLIGERRFMLPGALLTRQEAAALLGRPLNLEAPGNGGFAVRFTDEGDIAEYALDIIHRLAGMNIIVGYTDDTFRPNDNLSFAESASLIYRLSGLLRFGARELVTYFGSGIIGNVDGAGYETRFAMPHGLCFDNNGSLYVFDTFNAGVKRILNNRSETILGFSAILDDYGFTRPFYRDSERENSLFGRPVTGVSASNGDLFIVDSENNAIRLLRDDTVYTFAGGARGFTDGRRGGASFYNPTAIALCGNGNLYVADTLNHSIRRITPDGAVSTIAGASGNPGFLDGNASEALFNEPSGIYVDGSGIIYVADTGNHVIRKIEGDIVTTIAGTITELAAGEDYRPGGYSDGPALSAMFSFPRGLYYARGVLFIADTGNHAVRALTADGAVVTLAGSGVAGDTDGPPGLAMMNKPTALAYRDGVLYIADSLNNKIKTVSIAWELLG